MSGCSAGRPPPADRRAGVCPRSNLARRRRSPALDSGLPPPTDPAMPRRLSRLLAPLYAWLVLAPMAARAAEPVVVLPAFEVKDTHPWMLAQTGTLQILSLATELETQAFADRLQDA